MDQVTFVEYVYIDFFYVPRSKTRIFYKKNVTLENIPEWIHGLPLQATIDFGISNIILKPKRLYKDPFLGKHHLMVICESYHTDTKPDLFNKRVELVESMKKYGHLEPLAGIEQEYVLFDRKTRMPIKWLEYNNPGCDYIDRLEAHSGAGGDRMFGREIAVEHVMKCIDAGVKMFGMNGEALPSQWEFQVGTCDPLKVADDLMIARYILHRVTEKYDCYAVLHPKPFMGQGNNYGSGGHCNFSTKALRSEGGLKVLDKIMKVLEKNHKDDLKHTGEGNNLRMLGTHETPNPEEFKYMIGHRYGSVRINDDFEKTGKGYFEDRRPGGNVNPYLYLRILLDRVGEAETTN